MPSDDELNRSVSSIVPRARIQPNGELHFVKRGAPPRIVDGYKVSQTDPYVFVPTLPPCKFRNQCWRTVCGGMTQKIDCAKFKMNVKGADCFACTEREGT